ncbi:MAG: hypothetical protein ABGY42_15735 [bacterium]
MRQMVLDLHVHSELSDDSRAGVSTYMKVLGRKREERPLDGIVLTEHRQWNAGLDYRALEDEYGLRILRGAEVETDYGHILVYGVNDEITARFDFSDIRLHADDHLPRRIIKKFQPFKQYRKYANTHENKDRTHHNGMKRLSLIVKSQNGLMVVGSYDNIDALTQYVKKMDKPIAQILIEVLVVQSKLDFSKKNQYNR